MADVRWRGYSHQQMFDMIKAGPGASASTPLSDYWNSLTEDLGTITGKLDTALSTVKASWEGSASDGAQGAMTPLGAWSSDAQTGSSIMKISADDQANFVSTARNEMPKPVQVTTPAPSGWQKFGAAASLLTGNGGPAAQVAAQSADHESQEKAQTAAADKAVDVMSSYQSNSEWNGSTLGTFNAPPQVTASVPPPAGGTDRNGVDYYLPSNTGQSNSGTTSTSGWAAPVGGPGGNPPSIPIGPGPGPIGPGPGPIGPGPGLPPIGPGPGPIGPGPGPGPGLGPILPIGPGPGPGGPVEGGGPIRGGGPGGGGLNGPGSSNLTPEEEARLRATGGLGEGGLRGPGGSGSFGGGSGSGGASSGAGGVDAESSKSALGRGGSSGAGNFGAEEALGRGGIGGGSGAGGRPGGPMGGGRGAKGEEDLEHEAADYLIETEDVFGDERMVAPPVIGGDDPQ